MLPIVTNLPPPPPAAAGIPFDTPVWGESEAFLELVARAEQAADEEAAPDQGHGDGQPFPLPGLTGAVLRQDRPMALAEVESANTAPASLAVKMADAPAGGVALPGLPEALPSQFAIAEGAPPGIVAPPAQVLPQPNIVASPAVKPDDGLAEPATEIEAPIRPVAEPIGTRLRSDTGTTIVAQVPTSTAAQLRFEAVHSATGQPQDTGRVEVTAKGPPEATASDGPSRVLGVEASDRSGESDDSAGGDLAQSAGPMQVAESAGQLAAASPEGDLPRSLPVIEQVRQAIQAPLADTAAATATAGAPTRQVDLPQDRQIELRLDPAELGQLTITLQQDGETLVVRVVADRTDTLDLLRRNADQLLQEFRSAGIRDAQMSFDTPGQGRRDAPPGGNAAILAGLLPEDTAPATSFGHDLRRPGHGIPQQGAGLNIRI